MENAKETSTAPKDTVALWTLSYLNSTSTTWLRACSRKSKKVFVRNCPVSTRRFLYFEFAEFVESDELLACTDLERVPKANPYSPLACWRVRLDADGVPFLGKTPHRLLVRLWQCREFVLAAAARNGALLQRVRAYGSSLARDREVVSVAVASRGQALEFADARLRRDRDVIFAAVTSDWRALAHVPDNVKHDPAFLLAVLAHGSSDRVLSVEEISKMPSPEARFYLTEISYRRAGYLEMRAALYDAFGLSGGRYYDSDDDRRALL